MKRITIILSALIAGLLSSCSIEGPWEDGNTTTGTTAVSFTVNFTSDDCSVETKAFADKPAVTNLYLAVFNEDGKALVEYVKADPVQLATENGTAYQYTAKLKTSDQKRIIHFIANAPDAIGYGSEEDAIGNLVYSFDKSTWTGQDAYWGYVELANGICDSNSSGYTQLQQDLSAVVLIRNFAKIQVKKADDSNIIEIKRFWINNFPAQSSIAPYNRLGQHFETTYATYTNASDADKGGYKGYCPASSGLVSLSGAKAATLALAQCDGTKNWTAYTYEREKPESNPLCIIVGATSDLSSEETFYKIDLRDAEGKYMPILRNFVYTVTIGTVEKVGESSVDAAINSVGNGSIDTNLELQDLTNISNGTSKITVNKTEAVIFSNDPETLIYQYIPNITADEDGDGKADIVNTTLDQLLNMGFPDEAAVQAAHLSYVKITRENGVSGAVFSSMEVDDNDKDGSRTATLRPEDAMNGIPRTETITVTGYYYNPAPGKEKYETLSRTVKYQIRNRLQFYLKINPNMVTGNQVGQNVDLTIAIEENLPASLFTLDLTVIARNMSVTPVDKELPIKTEIIDGKPVFCFTKAITWKEYNEADTYMDEDGVIRKHFVCNFKTNTTEFDDVDKETNPNQGEYFLVTHKYFDDAGIVMYTGDLSKYRFSNMHFDKDYIVPGRTANYTFTMSALPADGTVYISVENLTLNGMSPASGVTDPVNEDFTVYELPVSKLTETIAVTPTSGSVLAYIKPFDSQFNPVKAIAISIHPLQFSDLKLVNLANEEKAYLVGARTARISFHLDEMPSTANAAVTIKLTNLTPVSLTAGTGMTNITSITDKGSGVYEIVPSSQDITIDVTPTVGDGITAKYELSNTEFDNNSCSSVIKKLSFTNVKLLNVANINSDHVIGGKTARVYFTLEDLPTSANQTITLTLTNLTPVSTTAGTGMTNITSITDKGSGVYEIVASDKTVTLDVIPTGGQTNASYTVANNEFYNGASGNVTIQKLSFLNLALVNANTTGADYVVGGKPAFISFSLEDLPSSANQSITLTMTNLTPVSTDPTSGEMTGISSFSGSNGNYTFVPSGKNIKINVIPTAGDNLKASYTLANAEFIGNGKSNVDIRKLTFSNLKFTYPTGKNYLLAGGQASISFSMDQLPSDGNVTLYIKNATPVGLSPTGTVSGFNTYTIPVDSKTKTLNVTVGTGSNITAEFYLGDTEFYAMTTAQHATAPIKTTYTIDWSKVLIKSDDTGNPAQGNTAVTVYTTYNSSTGACSNAATALGDYQSFTTTDNPNAGYASATSATTSIDSSDGTEKYYFKFTKDDVDYISQDGVTLATLAKTTTTPEVVNVICNIQMITYTIEANSIFFTGDGINAMGGLKSVSVRLGANSATNEIVNLTPSNGYNTKFTVTCKKTDVIYFHCVHNNGTKQYNQGPVPITDIDAATSTNPYKVQGSLQ